MKPFGNLVIDDEIFAGSSYDFYMQGNKDKNLVVELTFAFSIHIIKYAGELQKQKRYVLATPTGANGREAQNAESKADFIHKMKMAAKEADATEYWLLLCNQSENHPKCDDLLTELFSIIKVLSKIISSSKASIH